MSEVSPVEKQHRRLQVVEVIVFLSLVLSLVQGYMAHENAVHLQSQIDTLRTQPR